MPALHILSPGFLTTIQDAGRFGFATLGVSPAGAADMIALRLGNRLVDNEENTGALEMTLVGGTFAFECDNLIALTGADCEPALDDASVPMWASMFVRAGQTLQCRATKNGARSYLCVHGGFKIPPVMNSVATHLQSGIGGKEGRALKKGEALEIASATVPQNAVARRINPEALRYLREKNTLRVTRGPQADFFSSETLQTFYSKPYRVTESSNRVGLRLQGEPLTRNTSAEMITEGVSLGAIQVPGDGQPIILFVEHPTTGGYPKIANVISADLPRVGQLRPREEVYFAWVRFEEAVKLYRKQEEFLKSAALYQN